MRFVIRARRRGSWSIVCGVWMQKGLINLPFVAAIQGNV